MRMRHWVLGCFVLALALGLTSIQTALADHEIVSPAGVAGALYTYYLRIANYENFELPISIDYLAMIIIGGLGSVFGAVLGAIFIRLLPIALDLTIPQIAEGLLGVSYQSAANFLANFQLLIFGSLIILFLVVEPAGLARLWEHVKRYFRLWPFSY